MSIDENQKVILFDKFYNWLKEDGLKARKSERLHKKKIFAALLANDTMTLENFNDFLKDKEKDLKNEKEINLFNSDIQILKSLNAKQIHNKEIDDFNFKNSKLLKKTNFKLDQLVAYAKDYEKYLISEIQKVYKTYKGESL